MAERAGRGAGGDGDGGDGSCGACRDAPCSTRRSSPAVQVTRLRDNLIICPSRASESSQG